jgi:hypothetical protein
MKIAIVTWLLNDIGGINSWTENIIKGFTQLGHKVQLYYSTHQNSLACKPDAKVPRSRRFHLLPAQHLSYRSNLGQAIKTLNGYDLILFAHPSPHPTKACTGLPCERHWQMFYTHTKPFKISVFHDRHWDRSNPWMAEVRDHVNYVHAAQHHFVEAVERFTLGKIPHNWGVFPLSLPKVCPSNVDRARRFIVATQWLAIKKHKELLPIMPKLKIPVHSYGSGQTYHKLLPQMQQVCREDHHQDQVLVYNKTSRHIHYGHTEYRQLLAEMARAWFAVDLSIQGMTNMTHWEPLTVGTISIMENRVQADKYCEIPADCCLTVGLETLLDDLNKIAITPTSELLSIQQRAWKFIQRCESSKVAAKLLKDAGVV